MNPGTAIETPQGTAVGSSHPLAASMTTLDSGGHCSRTLAPDKAASKVVQQAMTGFKYPSRNGIFESLGLQRQRQGPTPLQHKPRRRTALDKHRRFLSQLQHSVWRGKVTLMQQRVLKVQLHALSILYQMPLTYLLLQDTRQRHSAKQQGSPTLKKFSAALRKAILDGQDLSSSWTPAKMAAAMLHKQQTGLLGTIHGGGTTPSRAFRDAPKVCSEEAAACLSRLHLGWPLALMLAGRPVGAR